MKCSSTSLTKDPLVDCCWIGRSLYFRGGLKHKLTSVKKVRRPIRILSDQTRHWIDFKLCRILHTFEVLDFRQILSLVFTLLNKTVSFDLAPRKKKHLLSKALTKKLDMTCFSIENQTCIHSDIGTKSVCLLLRLFFRSESHRTNSKNNSTNPVRSSLSLLFFMQREPR